MTIAAHSDLEQAEKFVEFVGSRNFDAMPALLHPEVRLRAFTPNHVFAMFGPEGTVLIFRNWFADIDEADLAESEIEQVSDRIRIRYQFDTVENGGLCTTEQLAYCAVENGLITDLQIICSGPRPRVIR